MLPVFDYAGSLRRMGNDPALFQDMIVLFQEDAPQYLATIQRCTASGDYSSLKRAAHTLKGLVLTFGATRGISAAINLELVAASAAQVPAERNNLQPAIEELEAAVNELFEALSKREWCVNCPKVPSPPPNNASRSGKH